MPKPKTKKELITACETNFSRLFELVDSFPKKEADKEFPKGTLNRNIRDVLAHLHEWHLMMIRWYEIGMSGRKPIMPAEGYKWNMLLELNQKIWKESQSTTLKTVRKELNESYLTLMKIIQSHSNDELFEKRRYKWTGTTSLGAYIIANTSSHYDWAVKLILKAKV